MSANRLLAQARADVQSLRAQLAAAQAEVERLRKERGDSARLMRDASLLLSALRIRGMTLPGLEDWDRLEALHNRLSRSASELEVP